MSETHRLDEATIDLIVKLALEGLSPQEEALLDRQSPAVQAEILKFEQAAAAVSLAAIRPAEPLSAQLRERIEAGIRAEHRPPTPIQTARRPVRGASYGWWAAAACLILAIFMSMRTPLRGPAEVTASLPAARADLLARPDSLTLSWKATGDAGAPAVSGDLVWNPATQRGFMRFVGLPRNDPAAHQYQLWIFDAERDERYPVDGGVFNVPAGATEVVVPIQAALKVHVPKLFAVTLEKPGGVVVSAREHILVTAQPG